MKTILRKTTVEFQDTIVLRPLNIALGKGRNQGNVEVTKTYLSYYTYDVARFNKVRVRTKTPSTVFLEARPYVKVLGGMSIGFYGTWSASTLIDEVIDVSDCDTLYVNGENGYTIICEVVETSEYPYNTFITPTVHTNNQITPGSATLRTGNVSNVFEFAIPDIAAQVRLTTICNTNFSLAAAVGLRNGVFVKNIPWASSAGSTIGEQTIIVDCADIDTIYVNCRAQYAAYGASCGY